GGGGHRPPRAAARTRRRARRSGDSASGRPGHRHPGPRRSRSRGQPIRARDRRDRGRWCHTSLARRRAFRPDAGAPATAPRMTVEAAGALAAALAMSSAIFAPFARGRSWPPLSLAHPDLRHLDDAGWRWPLTRWEALRTGCILAGAVLSIATALPVAVSVAVSAVGPSILVRAVADRLAFEERLDEEVRARTGGLRAQVILLALVVPAIAAYIALTVPSLAATLGQPIGRFVLIPAAAVLEVVGVIASRR